MTPSRQTRYSLDPNHPSTDPRKGRGRQMGSAYLMTLVAILLTTLMGLLLSEITQTELLLGSHETRRQRVFFAAESGIAIAAARALVANDRRGTVVLFDDTPPARDGVDSAPVRQLHELDISPFYPILDVPCNFCQVNDAGTYRETAFRKVNHALTVTATRIGTGGEEMAQKTLSTMIELQPWKVSNDALAAIDDPDELEKIRF